MQGTLYIISAPSGAGKTSLVNKLITLDSCITVSISTTTRTIRPGEAEGVNYHFVSPEVFAKKINEGDFLEHAKVFDHDYGTSKATVTEQLAKGKDVILEIDWQGAQQIRQQFPKAQSIFILPPSLTELERRLTGRGTDSLEIIQRRMKDAINEMQHFDEFDFLIINNHFNTALSELHHIFLANRLSKDKQVQRHNSLLTSLTTS